MTRGPASDTVSLSSTSTGMFNTGVLYQDPLLDNNAYSLSGKAKSGSRAGGKREVAYDTASLRSQDDTTSVTSSVFN